MLSDITKGLENSVKDLGVGKPNNAYLIGPQQPIKIEVYSNVRKAFEKAKNILTKEFPSRETLIKGTTSFIKWAATKSPPNMGSTNMLKGQTDKEKLLYRPILWLSKLVRGQIDGFRPDQADIDALRKGFRFKVLDTRDKKQKTLCYTKTKEEAETQARIVNRGLLRTMWGLNAPFIGARLDHGIRRILKESPHLKSLTDLNPMMLAYDENGQHVELINAGKGSVTLKQYVIKNSYKYAVRAMQYAAKYEALKTIQDALDTTSQELEKAFQGAPPGFLSVYQNLAYESLEKATGGNLSFKSVDGQNFLQIRSLI